MVTAQLSSTLLHHVGAHAVGLYQDGKLTHNLQLPDLPAIDPAFAGATFVALEMSGRLGGPLAVDQTSSPTPAALDTPSPPTVRPADVTAVTRVAELVSPAVVTITATVGDAGDPFALPPLVGQRAVAPAGSNVRKRPQRTPSLGMIQRLQPLQGRAGMTLGRVQVAQAQQPLGQPEM